MSSDERKPEETRAASAEAAGDVLRAAHEQGHYSQLGDTAAEAEEPALSTAGLLTDIDADDDEEHAPVAPSSGPGRMLRAARERHGLSQAALAQYLNLNVERVRALEEEDFDQLPGATYVRGYLRAWARQLGEDERPLLAAYNQMAGVEAPARHRPVGSGSVSGSGTTRRRKGPAVALGLVVVLAGAGGWYAWQQLAGESPSAPPESASAVGQADEQGPGDGSAGAPESAAATEPGAAARPTPAAPEREAPVVEEPEALAEVGQPETTETAPGTAGEGPQASSTAAAPPAETPGNGAAPAAEPTPEAAPPGPSRLSVAATGADSWVEIEDAEGERLMFDILKAGEERALEGVPPFEVFLGNAPAVVIEHEGEPFDHGAFTKENRTARFTVGDDEG